MSIRTIKTFLVTHKVMSIVGGIIILILGYWGYGKLTDTSGETRYVTTTVQKGSIITSISGTGQVSASNQVDLKPKVSGDVISVNVTSGQEVAAGALIAQLDSRDAQKAVRDAQVNLDSAKLALDKLNKPVEQLTLLQAENALAQANESKKNAEDSLARTYDDAFNTIATTFSDLPTILDGLNTVFFDSTMDRSMENIIWYVNQTSLQSGDDRPKAVGYQTNLYAQYPAARTAYGKTLDQYKTTSRVSDSKDIETLIDQTYATTRTIADTVKTGSNFVNFINDIFQKNDTSIPTLMTTHRSNLSNYTSTINNDLSNLLAIKNSIQSNKETIVSAERTIAEKTESIAQLKAGADALDIQSQQLSIRQKENALQDAREKLADYSIRAPFAGTIATLSVKRSDSVSSATSIATLITRQKIAEIALNEVDVAKVKVGQKATLTFDAIDGLTISGMVAEINTIGTVSQGVVSYTVKIGFDTQDDRIKPGMSVSAAIITDMKQDIIAIPSSAIKTQGTERYVEVFDTPLASATGTQGTTSNVAPRAQTVEVGISNDTMTEIVSGLSEGQQIVTRTIAATAKTTTQTAPSLLQGAGGGTRTTGR